MRLMLFHVDVLRRSSYTNHGFQLTATVKVDGHKSWGKRGGVFDLSCYIEEAEDEKGEGI